MSWSGLKKAINRAGTSVMVKTGQIESSVDLEYEFEEKRYKMMEQKTNRLQKELKEYLNTLRVLTGAQQNVSEVLSRYYGTRMLAIDSAADSSGGAAASGGGAESPTTAAEIEANATYAHASITHDYFEVMKKLNSETIQSLEQPYFQTVLNPLARFNSYYIEVNEAIKKRSRKQLDYDALNNRVRKLSENPPALPAVATTASIEEQRNYEKKLADSRQDLDQAEIIYENLNRQLKDELPRLINLRIPFLDPSFESFVKLQLLYFSENHAKLNELQGKIDLQTRQDYQEGRLENKLDDVLLKMKELSITGAT